MLLSQVVAVVVHHRRFPTVIATVGHLISQGLAPRSICVVDNSEDDLVSGHVRDALPDGVQLLVTRNNGYAAAVNSALSELGWLEAGRLVLVCSHEVVPYPGCLAALVAVVEERTDVAVAGPTLIWERPGSNLTVWSLGGRRHWLTGRPFHVRRDTFPDSGPAVKDREWLDGSFTLYRAEALLECPLDESFFLYFEETDCHVRLRLAGWRVVWVADAVAEQAPGGMPDFLHGRNLTRLLRRYGKPATWLLGVVVAGMVTGLRVVAGRADRRALRDFLAGVRSATREGEGSTSHIPPARGPGDSSA